LPLTGCTLRRPSTQVAPGSPLAGRILRVVESVGLALSRDEYGREEALLGLLMEYERQGMRPAHPEAPREELLESVRRRVLASARRPLTVSDLAEVTGKSRSHYTHDFRRVTGLSPARYVAQVRLAEVERLLTQTDMKLERIASETGYANATHLCKVFRRHYHVSPDVFRRQMA